jgi:hypothetical protein
VNGNTQLPRCEPLPKRGVSHDAVSIRGQPAAQRAE